MKFNKMKMIFIAVIALTLSACSNTQTKEQIAKDEKDYQTSYGKYAENSKVAKINLTEDGKVKSIDIGNQNLRPPSRKVEKDGFATVLVKETFQTARTVLGGNAAMALVAIKGFEAAGDKITDSNNSNQEAHETIGGDKASGSIDKSQQANINNEDHETIGGDKAGEYIDKHNEENQQINNSVNESNNGGNDNSSTLTKEPIPAAADEVE